MSPRSAARLGALLTGSGWFVVSTPWWLPDLVRVPLAGTNALAVSWFLGAVAAFGAGGALGAGAWWRARRSGEGLRGVDAAAAAFAATGLVAGGFVVLLLVLLSFAQLDW